MKTIIKFCAITLLVFTACKQQKTENKIEQKVEEATNYNSFGAKISSDKAMTSNEMLSKFKTMKVGDTVNVKFASNIKDVCVKKGCWMTLPLDKESETMVRFKDYGFFMPLDAKGSEVIVNGKAFVKETSVKELQHYAEDAGKSKQEITKITTPKIEFAFEADGVLLKK